ncbi:hypothetical protein, variant 1 [Aphanomyces invadans]|uniref:Membrane transporter protein n=1 Tax=Aphanomyces invadans TaxID=157072 RepID=A0A024UDV9_9STRA|nr:hypothetical protein, variant 1 [Aphanomyces invadans]ETW04601.1 hypothetical protein, variant 1 [Aphanomyces invadans]|eukprot:XP_008866039.1 hypothetical protein, variant 1 [Aphanomyces invadans]
MRRHETAVHTACLMFLLLAASADASAQVNGVVGVTCSTRSDCGQIPSLGCRDSKCAVCVSDNDCGGDSFTTYRCVNRQGGVPPVCLNKNVFSPFTGADILAAFLAALSTALGAACGLGGGGLLVPLFIVVVGLTPKFAIPLSKATILGGAAATYWSNYGSKHPYASRRPIVDYALAGLMEPPTLIGTIVGVMANGVFPSWLILALLILLLAFVTYRVTKRANAMHAKENAENAAAAASTSDLPDVNNSTPEVHVDKEDHDDGVAAECVHFRVDDNVPAATNMASVQDSLLATCHAQEMDVFPFRQCILPLLVCIAAILAQSLLRGGHGAPSLVGVACGSALYWLLILPPTAILAAVTFLMGRLLLRRTHLYAACGMETVKGDVAWTRHKTYVAFPLQCVVAGFASALLGIGGGIVQGPLMLEHGVTPLVQSATASYMILYTSTSTTIQYTIAGQFPGDLQYGTGVFHANGGVTPCSVDYVLWYVALGFLGGVFGKKVVERLIQRTGRMSYFLYFLAANSAIQAVAMGYIGVSNVLQDIKTGDSIGFSSLCHG